MTTASPSYRSRISLLVILLIIAVAYFTWRKSTMSFIPSVQPLLHIDALSETNWSTIHAAHVPLPRAHRDGLLHRKVWLLPFDELWQIGLSSSTQCPSIPHPAVDAHVPAGMSVSDSASQLATKLTRGRRATALLPVGRPFVLATSDNRELVHVFALMVEGVFPRRWFKTISRPVTLVRVVAAAMNPAVAAGAKVAESGDSCDSPTARWMAASVAYAVRRFIAKRFIPRSNPVHGARFDEPLCCRADMDEAEDLRLCGVSCARGDVTNVLAHFPQGR